jgi:hypothetical protein
MIMYLYDIHDTNLTSTVLLFILTVSRILEPYLSDVSEV